MFRYKVIENYNFVSCQPSYGIQAEVVEGGICSCVETIPDISCDKDFVCLLAQRCDRGQLSPMHLLDVVLDALP